MSFILDALKKVDPEKQLGSTRTTGGESRAALLERSKQRRKYTLMLAIALASAGLTFALLRFVPATSVGPRIPSASASASPANEPISDRGNERGAEPEPESEAEAGPDASAEPVVAPPRTRMVEPVAGKAKHAAQDRSKRQRRSSAGATQPPVAATADTDTTDTDTEAAPEAGRARSSEPEPTLTATAREGLPAEPSAAEPSATDIRLVGSGGSRSETQADADPIAPSTIGFGPPAGLPHLVLQGTSVINGRPVAVISDRRVFEGDHIEGARVVRIQERSVELEFEGSRFTLSL